MLQKVVDFVETHPQRDGRGNINYIIYGGSAVRLNQEFYANVMKYPINAERPITDIDIVNLSGKPYPTHSTEPEDMFQTGTKLTIDEIIKNSLWMDIDNQVIKFGNKEILTVLKSVQTPREKDYFDIKRLNELKLDKENLEKLYKKCNKVPDAKLYTTLLFETLGMDNTSEGSKLFQTLPNYASLIHKTHPAVRDKVKEIAKNHILETEKTAYEVGCDLSNITKILEHIKASRKVDALKALLKRSDSMNYTEFDIETHYKTLPTFQLGGKAEKDAVVNQLVAIG